MKIKYGDIKTQFGPGVTIELTGDEIALAIDSFLVAHNVITLGPRTVTVNNGLCERGQVYVDPAGAVMFKGKRYSGRGKGKNKSNVPPSLPQKFLC